MGIWDFSTIADANATADPSINFQEGQPAATVNNSARTLMQRLRFWADDVGGTIITGGTGNAYTATTASTIPSLRAGVTIQVRANRANTGAATLNVDGKGAKPWRAMDGGDAASGRIGSNAFYRCTYYAAADEWRTDFPPVPCPLGQCRLGYVSATSIRLDPFNGNQIFVNGAWLTIPAAGATLANTSLAASTLYYVYAYSNAGVLTLEASTTGHAADATYGNRTKTGDGTRTLVGMVRTNASSQFQDDAANRLVASWFNRLPRACQGAAISASTTSTTDVEIATAGRINFLSWADAASASVSGYIRATTAGCEGYSSLVLDGAPLTQANPKTIAVNNFGDVSLSSQFSVAEGFHYLSLFGHQNATASLAFACVIQATLAS